MDPVSITAACVSLTATITKTSVSVTTFVRSVRAARSDLDAVSRELASLKTLLELIAEDAEDAENFPDTLRKHITGILANCELVLVEVQRLVDKYSAPGIIKGSKWALAGSEDVAKLKLSLEAHKSALEIALEMVTLSVTKQIKADTTEIRDDTAAIKQDTADILQEIARLRAQLPDDLATLRTSFQEPDTKLAQYLDDLTSYAETVCWSGEDSDTDDEKKGFAKENTPVSTPPSQRRKDSDTSARMSGKTQHAQEKAPSTEEATSDEDSDSDLHVNGKSQETLQAKVPPAFANHIADLESRLKTTRTQRLQLEDLMKDWGRGTDAVARDGEYFPNKSHCENRLAEIREKENDIGWTLHQAKREYEKRNPSSISDSWFRKVMTEREDPSWPHGSDVVPETRIGRPQNPPEEEANHVTDVGHTKDGSPGRVSRQTYDREDRSGNDVDDKQGVNQETRHPHSGLPLMLREDREAAQLRTASLISSDTVSKTQRKLPKETRPQRILPKETKTTSPRKGLKLESNAAAGITEDVEYISDPVKEGTTALFQPGQVVTLPNQQTSVTSVHGTWNFEQVTHKSHRKYVTRATDMQTGERMYIRIIQRDVNTDSLIVREVAMHKIIGRNKILKIRACVQSESSWYLHIPYRTTSLAERMQLPGFQLSVVEARKYAGQIGLALAYCHAHAIVHLNLSAAEVLIVDDGTVRVAGFGQIVTTAGHLKHPGSIIVDVVRRRYEGDPKRAPLPAPEILTQAGQSEVDWRKADVWSFGIIIYTMVAKRWPTFNDILKMGGLPGVHEQSAFNTLLADMFKQTPRERITIEEVGKSAWMTIDGARPFKGPDSAFGPFRLPLKLPLDLAVLEALANSGLLETGMSLSDIKTYMIHIIESEKYQQAVAAWKKYKEVPGQTPTSTVPATTTGGFFDRIKREVKRTFYFRNFSRYLRDMDNIELVFLYYLFKEKLERDAAREEKRWSLASR